MELLSLVVDVMQYFSEATNILQCEGFPTLNCVIPVVDSLENALIQASRENAAINALCECLLISLGRQHSVYICIVCSLLAMILTFRQLKFRFWVRFRSSIYNYIYCIIMILLQLSAEH